MKTTKLKKLLALLLTGLMTVSMFSGVALAEDEVPTQNYEETNAYVMNYSGGNIEGYEDWDGKRLYDTPYRTDIVVSNKNGSKLYWGYCTASVLNMIDVSKLEQGGEGAYATIPVYCVDAITDGVPGVAYRRMNLEDSTYFDDEVAGRIRAIFMNSFPYIEDMETITAAVNAWNAQNGSVWGEVKELNKYEVTSATQSVIWTITNNGYLAEDCYAGLLDENGPSYKWAEVPSRIADSVYHGYNVEGNADVVAETDYTRNNINAVARYLESLAPMAPQASLISETSLENLTIKKVQEADGTYTATVSVKVVVDEKSKSNLTLTAVVPGSDGEDKAYAKLENITTTTEHTFVIRGVDENTTIKLAVDGAQTAGDVYLYDPVNGRDASQTMAGYDNSTKPVHAEIAIGPDRIINFNKIGKVEKDGVATEYPLEGIQFEIYYAGTVDEYTAFAQAYAATNEGATDEAIQAAYTAQAVANKAETPLVVVTTDATGKATHNFGNTKDADGIYLVIELPHVAIEETLAPFVVAMPMSYTDEATETYIGESYVLNLYPKNKVYPGPEVEKNVTKLDNDVDSFAIGQIQTWIIRGDIPKDMAAGKSYVLTDIMDYRLTYKDIVKVAVEREVVDADATEDGKDPVYKTESVALTADTDYVLTVGKSKDEAKNDIDIFKVELTKAGMEKVATTAGDAYKDWEVRVYFDSIIDEDADNAAGVMIPNDVTLDYENSVGIEFTDEDGAKVYTCGINVYKYDAKNEATALAGATFKLAKVVAEGTEGAVQLVINKDTAAWVVYQDFYNTPVIELDDPATAEENEATQKVNFVVTDATGKAMIYGLPAGEYYLVETKAPAGYNLLSYPVAVTLNEQSHLVDDPTTDEVEADMTVKVANSNTFQLPATGGIGTVIFTVTGGLMTLAGGSILALKKREEEN